jgi:hypothetical protein
MATTTNNGWTTPDDTDLVKDGALAIRDLGDAIDTSVGNLLWENYTPVFTNFTLGNGTLNFTYVQTGKTVHVRGLITLGSTSVVTGSIIIRLPINLAISLAGPVLGNARYSDVSGSAFVGTLIAASSSDFNCTIANVGATYPTISTTSATIPFTWTTNDSINVYLTYQGV